MTFHSASFSSGCYYCTLNFSIARTSLSSSSASSLHRILSYFFLSLSLLSSFIHAYTLFLFLSRSRSLISSSHLQFFFGAFCIQRHFLVRFFSSWKSWSSALFKHSFKSQDLALLTSGEHFLYILAAPLFAPYLEHSHPKNLRFHILFNFGFSLLHISNSACSSRLLPSSFPEKRAKQNTI